MASNSGQRGFAGAGRAVEDDRAEAVGGEQAAEEFAFAEEMLLADELVKSLRPHARGQRLGLAAVFGFGLGEEGGHAVCRK